MNPRHQVSRAAIELIKRFEGYRRSAAQLPDGRWTIGHGHTLSAREGAEVSEGDAEALLLYDLIAVAHAVREAVFAPLNQNQFDALCAFTFNIGVEAFQGSQVLKRLNEGAVLQAACAMELWRKAEFQGEAIVIDALVRRRAAEKTLFLTPADGVWPVAPTPLLKPGVDNDAARLVPRDEPAAVTATLEDGRIEVRREGEPAPDEGLAPQEDDPIAAAAEAVSARLETLFQPEPEAPAAESAPESEPGPQSERASEPEPAPPAAEEGLEDHPDVPPFTLEPPPPPEGEPVDDIPEAEAPGPESGDLFEQPPAAANDPMAAAFIAPAGAPPEGDFGRERVVIDDTSPFPFVPARVQPIAQKSGEGFLSLILLAILGLAFFAGGLFWALNAQPGAQPAYLTPRVVGALAMLAGVGLFSLTLYIVLQRLGREAERQDEDRRP